MDNIPPPPPGFVLEGAGSPPPPPQGFSQAQPQARPQPQGRMDAASLMPALIQQESGGRAGVLGPMTRYGQAIGRTQMLPATAREMAAKIGIPYDESLLRGTSPEAAAYQDRLGQAYLQEGLDRTGNVRDALRYYHGGPDRSLWGPKTNAYADQVMGRVGQDYAPQPQQQAQAEPPPPPPGFQIETGQTQQPKGEPGSSQDNPIDLTGPLYAADVERLRNQTGLWVNTGDRVFQTTGNAYNDNPRSSDQQVGARTYVRDPNNFQDNATGFFTAASEQIPFADEASALANAAMQGRSYSDVRNQQIDQRALANQTNRGSRVAGGLAGFGLGLAAPGGGWVNGAQGAARIGRAAALGAGYGGLYGAGNTDGSLTDRAQAAALQATLGAGTGAALQRGANALGEAAASARANPSAQRELSNLGVQLTPGQMIGGSAQRIEDALTSTPILGDAIKDARRTGFDTYNRAVINSALEPIGATASSGRQGMREADAAISQAYSQALDGVYVPRDPGFDAAVTAVARQNPLPPSMEGDFNALLNSTLQRVGDGMDGQAFKQLDSELAANIRAAQSGSQNNPAQRLMADKLTGLRQAVRGMLERSNPDVAQALGRADQAAAGMYRVRDAAQGLNTAARDGLFTAADLNRAVRNGDNSAGNRLYGRGEAMLQNLSEAGMQVLPSTVPDSGTPLRSIFTMTPTMATLGGAGAVGVPLAGPAAVVGGAGLFGGSAIYGKGMQGLINRAYRATTPGAARQVLADAAAQAAQSPVLQPVYEALQSMLRPLLLDGQTATPTRP